MYRHLLPLQKQFIFVRQGAFNRYYEGKLTHVDDEVVQIQSYKKDGSPEELWTLSLDTITEFSIGGRHLTELALKVSFLSPEHVTFPPDREIVVLESGAPMTADEHES